MTKRFALAVILCSLVTITFSASAADQPVDFNRDVRPILAKNCFACHGPDEGTREAELRLDSFDGATAELDGRRALVPGKPDESELVSRIESSDPDVVMPPPDSGHILKPLEKDLIRKWIAAGGEYKVHCLSRSRKRRHDFAPIGD